MRLLPLLLFLAGLLTTGCHTVSRPPATAAAPTNAPAVFVHEPVRHIPTWQKFNPVFWLGNADEPAPPPDFRPEKKFRTLRWYLRNPFHNLDHYVLGLSDKRFTRTGRFPSDVFNPRPGWNFAVCRYQWIRLPFVSYHRGRLEFYAGWRNAGNFGLAFRRSSPAPQEPPPAPN